jgi:rod shape-determining protein MreD
MRGSREASAFIALLIAYVLQTSVVARLQLPLGGPNLIFIFFLAWVLKHDAMTGAIIGFVVGLLMDFAPPAVSTAGAWTFVLAIVGYGIGTLATKSQDLGNSPVVGWIFMGAGLLAIFSGRVLLGASIGESLPGFGDLAKSLIGLLCWNLLLAPVALWFTGRLFHSLSPRAEMLR